MPGNEPLILELAAEHFTALHEFLAPYLAELDAESQAKLRAVAVDKLSRLTVHSFFELSIDITDELTRRLTNSEDPFLPVRVDFPPKRNQARQKLAVLNLQKFRGLALNLYYGLEHRYAFVASSVKEKYGIPPSASSSVSSRGYLRFAKLASITARPMSPQVDALRQQGNGSVGSEVRSVSGSQLTDYISSAVQGAQDDTKILLQTMQVRVADLEAQLTRERAEKATALADASKAAEREAKVCKFTDTNIRTIKLEQRYSELERQFQELQSKYERLTQDYASLQDDYNEQQQIAADIRAEASHLLDECKTLTEKNNAQVEKINSQTDMINKLKAQLESTAAANLTSSLSTKKRANPNIDFEKDDIVDAGIVTMESIEAYTEAVSNLLAALRSETPTNILVGMKGIIIACRGITKDSEAYENDEECGLTAEERDELAAAKEMMSTGLTGQMAIAKELANSFDASIAARLEAATAELTAAIIDLLQIYQRHTGLSNPVRNDQGIRNAENSNQGFDQSEFGGSSVSTQELLSTDLLKPFLEQQTDLIVQAIHSLLQIMRQTSTFDQGFLDIVHRITGIVDRLVQVSRQTMMAHPTGSSIQASGEPILQQLSQASTTMNELGNSMINAPPSNTMKQKLASSSYEIAK
eukprot:jgi/Hompol1/5112/HPOL_004157-RA